MGVLSTLATRALRISDKKSFEKENQRGRTAMGKGIEGKKQRKAIPCQKAPHPYSPSFGAVAENPSTKIIEINIIYYFN